MHAKTLDQLEAFRDLINRAITHLAPNVKPGKGSLDFTKDQLRLIAGALGTVGSAREVEAYVNIELQKWSQEPAREKLMSDLLDVVVREKELLELYDPNQKHNLQHTDHVKVFNADTGNSARTIPIDEFIQSLENIRNSSVFKR
ncbi:MAG: hypothetical protein ACKOX6_11180 [Bdellovibrio sp.]